VWIRYFLRKLKKVKKSNGQVLSLQKFQDFWTVSEIAKNRLEKGPDGFFWTVSNCLEKWVANPGSGLFGPNRPEFIIFFFVIHLSMRFFNF
jgi:hypothetical protein